MAREDLLYSFLLTLTFLIFTNADSHEDFMNNCVEFHLARLQEYSSTLETTRLRQNYSTQPKDGYQNISLFGSSPSDWTRLNLLREALPADSTIGKNFDDLLKILLVAHDQALKSNRSSQLQEVVKDFGGGKTVSSFDIENSTIQSSFDNESYFENSSISDETFVSALKINDSFVELRSDDTKDFLRNPLNFTTSSVSISSSSAVEKNLTPLTEEARKILGLASFNPVTKMPFTGKKESEESSTPQHFSSLEKQLSKSPDIRDGTLCDRSPKAENCVHISTNNQSESIANEEMDEYVPAEYYSLQSSMNVQTSTSISERKTEREALADSTTTQSQPLGSVSSDEFLPSRKQEKERGVETQYPEEFSSLLLFTSNPGTQNQFSTMTPNREVSKPTEQLLGTSSSTEYSVKTEKYFSAIFEKVLGSTSTTSELITIPSERPSIEEEEVNKCPWNLTNDSRLEIQSSMTTPTLGSKGVEKMLHPQDSWLEDRIIMEASTQNVNPFSSTSPEEEEYLKTEDDRIEKLENTDFSTNFKIKSNQSEFFPSNPTKTESTLEAYSRDSGDYRSRTQESSTVSIREQSKISENSWTTIFPNEKGSIIIKTDNKNDELKTTNFRDRSEIFQSEKSIRNGAVFLTDSSVISADNKTTFDDIQSTNYWDKIKIPEEVQHHLSMPEKAETDNPMNNFSITKSSDEKSKDIWRLSQNVNTTGSLNDKSVNRSYPVDFNQEIKNTQPVTTLTETLSHSTPQKTSISLPKQNFVKNALRASLTRNNQIFRDYKHESNYFKASFNKSDHRPSDVYKFDGSAKNRSFWRHQLDKQLLSTNNFRRLETIKESIKPINMERHEKSSHDTESNVPSTEKPSDSFKWSTHGRINKLRSRERDGENRGIEQQLGWFYRQGQTGDRIKARPKENYHTKIKVRCKNPQH